MKLEGLRVLDLSLFLPGPHLTMMMADHGADVIKIEPPSGEPVRNVGYCTEDGVSVWFRNTHRGKRSVVLDLKTEAGRAALLELAKTADVFITNYLPAARRKLKINVDDLRAVNPNLIYARGSAHGPKGPEAENGGFDGLTYWMRSGAGVAAMPADTTTLVGLPAPAFGDLQAGMQLAGGLAAALFHRERTGEATTVDISLMSAGVWAMQAYLIGCNLSSQTDLPHMDRKRAFNPIWNEYRTRDGQFIALAMFQADRYWADFCDAIGRPDLKQDPRFVDMDVREANREACIQLLDEEFAKRTCDEWVTILSTQKGQWSKVQMASDLNHDPQVLANGYLQDVDYGDGRSIKLASNPVQFNETAPALRPAPEHGQHTEEILLELGMDWEQIIELKDKGATN